MKHLFSLYILLILTGCTESFISDIPVGDPQEFYATFENAETRTYIDKQIRLRWNAEDCITLFRKNTYNREYMFTGATGANAGGFKQKSVDDEFWYGADVPNIYAVYPHSPNTQLDETNLFLTLTMPAEQTYAENSFGLGANTMVAISNSGQLSFKNVGSYLRVRLYGEDVKISSVTLTSKSDDAIAGIAKVTPTMNGSPICEMIGTEKSIRLTCYTPIAISSDSNAPTDFWIVVPPVTLTKGFSVTIEDDKGKFQIFDIDKPATFERNQYNNLKREVNFKIPNNQIWYTSSNGNVIKPSKTKFGDATIIKNEIINGKGIITFDKDVQTISSLAFYYISNLASITIPETVTSIAERAFEGTNISSINIPDGVIDIKPYAFKDCQKLKNVILPNKITKINNEVFQGCTELETIEIPQNVNSIGDYAFASCALKTINIPANVVSIGAYAFSCKLENVTIPNKVESIGNGAFSHNNFETITIPNNVTYIGAHAFESCKNLTSVILSDNITSIKEWTFAYCEKLENIMIPEKVTTLGKAAFLECSSLHSITLPNNITSIGDDIFRDCTSLNSIILSENIYNISTRAFYGCTNLYSIELPTNIKSINNTAFADCKHLSTITIPGNATSIGSSAFYGCTNLSSAIISNGVIYIGERAFSECTSLNMVSIPNSVTSIGRGAFYDCISIKSITIPKNVTTIGNSAFMGCAITEIHNKATTPPTCDGALTLGGMLQTCILYVPKGYLNTYKNSSAWKEFLHIYEE